MSIPKNIRNRARELNITVRSHDTTDTLNKKIDVKTERIKQLSMYHLENQLGYTGRDGKTILAINPNGEYVAIKLFKLLKSVSSIRREVDLQRIASGYRIAPKIYMFSLTGKFIVMKRLKETLFQRFIDQGRILLDFQEKELLYLFKRLDQAKIFHGDPNLLNFMYDNNNRLHVIDYGFAKPINQETISKYGPRPNIKYMTAGILVKTSELNPEIELNLLNGTLQKTINVRQSKP